MSASTNFEINLFSGLCGNAQKPVMNEQTDRQGISYVHLQLLLAADKKKIKYILRFKKWVIQMQIQKGH